MKWKLFFICSLLFFKSMAQNPISGISISMANTMPANISDWATAMPPVTIQANIRLDSNRQVPGYVQEAKILVTIKSGSGKVCGAYTPSTAPDASIKSLVRLYRGAEIEKLLGQSCTLNPGSYTLCVQFFANPNGTSKAISEEVCKQFTLKGNDGGTYTAPQNVLPADGKMYTEQEIKQPLTFRWTPIVPKPQEDVVYKVRVFEVRKGQGVAEAMKAGNWLVEKEAVNQTQYCCLNFNLGGGGYAIASDSKYGWYVEATDKQGKSLGSSAATMFSTASAGCGTNTDIVKVSCGPVVQGKRTYLVSVIFKNIIPTAGGQQCVTKMNNITSSTGTISGITTLPVTIPAGSTSATVTFNYTPTVATATTAAFLYQGVWNDGYSNSSNFGNNAVQLPNCVCKPCEVNNVTAVNKIMTYYNVDNQNTLMIRNTISATPNNVTKIEADLVLVRVTPNSDSCVQCNKQGNQQGNFTGNNQITNGNVTYWQQQGTAFVNGENSNPNISRSVTFVTNTAAGANISAGIDIDHYIGIAPPSCCGDEVEIWIRYTVWDKDCKVCEKLVKKTITRAGTCITK